jgi:hypothetical protein
MNSNTITPASIMQMGLERISKLVDIHGITSPEVYAACVRWGGILDDVNYPDTTCLHCGEPVVWNGARYIHDNRPKGPTAIWCISHSGREAEPKHKGV